ncbi:hypothetical protein D9M69_622850 [compost metagenome]
MLPEAFADLRIAEHQWVAHYLLERHVAIGQQGMAGGDRHYHRVEPDRLSHQALANLRRLGQADIEQVIVEPSDLLGKGDL